MGQSVCHGSCQCGLDRGYLLYLHAPLRDALIAETTRPLVSLRGDGAVVISRGVNNNPVSEPIVMVPIPLWIDPAGLWSC